jgi:ABC-type transporter Mla subunit MlaD
MQLMSAILLLVVIPAVIAFLFAIFVAYYAFADVNERQYNNSNTSDFSDVHRLNVGAPG